MSNRDLMVSSNSCGLRALRSTLTNSWMLATAWSCGML